MQADNVKRETCKEHRGNKTGRPVNSHNLYHSAKRQTQSAESCSHVSHDSKSCWEHFDGATWNDEMTHHLNIALKGDRVLLYDICISFHHCNSLIIESQCSCRTQRRFRMILLCFMGLFFFISDFLWNLTLMAIFFLSLTVIFLLVCTVCTMYCIYVSVNTPIQVKIHNLK